MKTIKSTEHALSHIDNIISKAKRLEDKYHKLISEVDPLYRESALNLLHYLALRSFDTGGVQQWLRYKGMPDLVNIEGHVMKNLLVIRAIISTPAQKEDSALQKKYVNKKKSEKLLGRNTRSLLGNRPNNRSTRIMVTLSSKVAQDYKIASQLMRKGMNSVRINCAHDNEQIWEQMIRNVQKASEAANRKCTIIMDLGGPKLRTGPMQPGPQVVFIEPRRNLLGTVERPARVWIAPPGIPPPGNIADAVIPVSESFIQKIKRKNILWFTDSRGKKRQITIERKQGKGRWGLCSDSAYITTGTELVLNKIKESGKEKNYVGELMPAEQVIVLRIGDRLLLQSQQLPGEPAKYDSQGNLTSPAHISCTMPEIFQDIKAGEPVFINDGKIEGIVESAIKEEIVVLITNAGKSGSKLRAGKGINFPKSKLKIRGLTEKDRKDLAFVAQHAHVVSLSFVNQASDVKELQIELEKYPVKPGIILKIETQKGFENLPEILLQAMQTYPVGIMIARGDLAIETGWENFATIQEEILRIGKAAHVPVIWATQVLEVLAKEGTPTRSEITDAFLSQRAECVMLNKGIYIEKAVSTLNKILIKTENHQKKKQEMLSKLKSDEGLSLQLSDFEDHQPVT